MRQYVFLNIAQMRWGADELLESTQQLVVCEKKNKVRKDFGGEVETSERDDQTWYGEPSYCKR